MGLKFEAEPQMKLGAEEEHGNLEINIQDGEGRTLQTIASVTPHGLILWPLAYSHADTPKALGFSADAFGKDRTIKVRDENPPSVRRTRVGKPVETTFRCRTGDTDSLRVGEAHKGVTFLAGDSVCVILDIEEATSLRDTIDAFIQEARED